MKDRKKMPRITIEVESETKKAFIEKATEDGFTLKGLILKWIKRYLRDGKF